MSAFLSGLKKITSFVFDVDGVLTDGTIQITETGEQLRTMNIKDGYALQLAVKRGYRVAIITGGKSAGVVARLKGLGLVDVFSGISDKKEALRDLMDAYDIQGEELLYMGDDLPDYAPMKMAGIAVCPADAVYEIKEISAYISPVEGGKGCVREIIEKTMKLQDKWHDGEGFIW